MIPKIFHRIWFGSAPPPEYIEYSRRWLELNPDWELREWTDLSDYSWMLNLDLFNEAAEHSNRRSLGRLKSNIARYEIVERFGGVYLDHDLKPLKPMGDILAGVDCFASEEYPGLVNNAIIGSVAGHQFMRSLVAGFRAYYIKNRRRPSWICSGPGYLTFTHLHVKGLKLLPTKLFYPYHHTAMPTAAQLPKRIEGSICEHKWGSRRGQVSVIIPYRNEHDEPWRKKALEYVLGQYEKRFPEYQVIVGTTSGGEWCKATAVEVGARKAYGDVFIVADGDSWLKPDLIEKGVEVCRRFGAWVVPYRKMGRLTPQKTEEVLAGGISATFVPGDFEERPYNAVVGAGIVILPRKVYEEYPMDPRFLGWGHEDEAWGWLIKTFKGEPIRFADTLIHLWHPPQERQSRSLGSPNNLMLRQRYEAARGIPAAMKVLNAESKAARWE